MKLSKTSYLIYQDCGKNAWLKIHKPEVYKSQPLSEFELMIIETGNDVDTLARGLFPDGVLLEDRDNTVFTKTLVSNKTPVIYQHNDYRYSDGKVTGGENKLNLLLRRFPKAVACPGRRGRK